MPDELWDGELTLQTDLQGLNDADSQSDSTDASNAPIIRQAFPDITPAKAADHRLWASVNCFALLPYTTMRWNQRTSAKAPCRTDEVQKLREWVQEHYLGHGVDMKQDNAAARLWWLTEMAERASPHSKHSADRLLSAMANDVEMYHQLLFRPYLVSSPRVVGTIYDVALSSGNDYLRRRPYPNRMLQNLNLKAAAVIPRFAIRRDPQGGGRGGQAPKRTEGHRINLKPPALRVLSLGGGVQSTVMCLMAEAGDFGDRPDFAIFADTHWEPQGVYHTLDWLREQVSFPIIVTDNGRSLKDDVTNGVNAQGKPWLTIPAYLANEDGSAAGINWRQCTKNYKLDPIRKKIAGNTRRKSS